LDRERLRRAGGSPSFAAIYELMVGRGIVVVEFPGEVQRLVDMEAVGGRCTRRMPNDLVGKVLA